MKSCLNQAVNDVNYQLCNRQYLIYQNTNIQDYIAGKKNLFLVSTDDIMIETTTNTSD